MTTSAIRAALLASLHDQGDDEQLDAQSEAAVNLGYALEISGIKLLKVAGGISDRAVRHEQLAGYQLALAKLAMQHVDAAIKAYEIARQTGARPS